MRTTMRALVRDASLLALLVGVGAAASEAPTTPAPAPPALTSPEVRADGSVVFRLYAPRATEVSLAGDFWVEQNRTEKLARGSEGIWSLTTEPLTPDYYSYFFTVDGIPMPDPANGQIKPGIRSTQSAFMVSGNPAPLVAQNDVPHGEVRLEYYRSASTGRPQRMHVYVPPSYGGGRARYPVVYLFHGGGDDDWGWVDIGRVQFMLDNLIAQGRARPMIVAMPSLWALEPPVGAPRADENEALFREDLLGEVVPWIERHFRTLAGPANRAVGGLGAGRNFLPDVLWPSLGTFGHAFFVSGGAGAQRFGLLQAQHPGVLEDRAHVAGVKFFLCDGANDASVADSRFLAAQLKQRGYRVDTFETSGTHGWPSFRRCFAEFAERAFRR